VIYFIYQKHGFQCLPRTEVNNERNIGIVFAYSVDLLVDRFSEYFTGSCHRYEGFKMNEIVMTERTYYLPLSGLDAVNYIVIASQIKVAAHYEVSAEHLHFLDDLRGITSLHKQHSRTEVARELIECMNDLLQRLDDAGLRLCFRMWSILNADELVHLALAEAESIDNEGNSHEAQQKSDSNGYGAVVAFLIMPESIPMLIHDYGNSHTELCVNNVPDWDALPDELVGA
jgi:hypothetical protein